MYIVGVHTVVDHAMEAIHRFSCFEWKCSVELVGRRVIYRLDIWTLERTGDTFW